MHAGNQAKRSKLLKLSAKLLQKTTMVQNLHASVILLLILYAPDTYMQMLTLTATKLAFSNPASDVMLACLGVQRVVVLWRAS